MEHISVLLKETIDMLNVKEDGIYVDCTLGRGGHSSEILKRCSHGHLYCFDMDQKAIEESTPRLEKVGKNFTCIHAPFEQIKERINTYGVDQVDGIVMDLGVSSPQFDDATRGFSYREDAKLDMRMDQSALLSAYDVVNAYSLEELTKVFREYGEEPFAYKIAKAIIKRREDHPIETTFELVDTIKSALPNSVLKKKGHPAKKVFQAIRIEVNQELSQLKKALIEGLELLKPGGRMVVITFHSLEDRIVKNAFKEVATPKKVDKRIPQQGIEKIEYRLLNRKPVVASVQELEHNPRSHSAKLRGVERNENEKN